MAAKKGLKDVEAQVDTHQNILYPLDFSFKSLSTFEDALLEKPRPRDPAEQWKYTQPDIDSSVDVERDKCPTNAIKFNNNGLLNWDGFLDVVDQLCTLPLQIAWIDLSFNELRSIPQCILDFQNLTVFYLHGNSISKISEVDKLGKLPKLKSLSLHGNDIETTPNYRAHVICRIPQLKTFDFSGVTKTDQAKADTIRRNLPTRKNKKEK
jgi:hypothetical protein